MGNKGSLIPTMDAVVDKMGKMTMRWLTLIQLILNGDPGTAWIPQFVGLTVVGDVEITGVYYENNGFIDFYARITPKGNTSSVAGTTYLELPFQPTSDGAAFATTGTNTTSVGIVAAQRRVYTPTWTTLTDPVTISGRVPTQS